MKIAIIDSGFLKKNFSNKRNCLRGYSCVFAEEINEYQIIEDDCVDKIGHGTAIVNILNEELEGGEIDVFKIYEDTLEISEEAFVKVLEYIRKNNCYELIHISSGIIQPSDWNLLNFLCKSIVENGTIMVAAFDNEGAISYPAAFPYVIGVDLSERKLKKDEYEFVEGNIVNIRASASFHRVAWIDPPVILAQGTSFSSVYITLEIIKTMKNGRKTVEEILANLKKNAVCVYEGKREKKKAFQKEIKKAIVFPFNKEMHSIARYKNYLPYKIYGFYDIRQGLKVGRKISEIESSIVSEDKILDVSQIMWETEFDTVILGHTDEIVRLTGIDYKKMFEEKCKKYQKRLFSFDPLESALELEGYWPEVSEDMVPENRFGKLRSHSKPVLGIWGTSSKQGKFTLQLKLKYELSDMGYKVGWLGTEPQSELFGANKVYPIGYNSTVSIKAEKTVQLLNEYMWEISCSECDIILVGSQSGTIPGYYHHLSAFPSYQYDLLFGTQPDYVILCINLHDDIEYIKRTIQFIEAAVDTKVIALVVYPKMYISGGIGANMKSILVDGDTMCDERKKIEEETKIKTYSLDSKMLIKDIIDVFSVK